MNGLMKHMDCRNFAAVDVAKGICHRTKELVLADSDHCEHCVRIPKCKFCTYFISTDEYLGICNAVPTKPVVYPDLITVTCELFASAEMAGHN